MTGLRTWLHTATERDHRLATEVIAESRIGWTLMDAALAFALLDATVSVLDNAILNGRDVPATLLSVALDDIYARNADHLTAPHPEDAP